MTLGYDESGQPQSLIELRPMDVGDVLDGTIRIYRRNPWVLIGIMAVMVSVPLVIIHAVNRYFSVIMTDVMALVVEGAGPEVLSTIQTTEVIIALAIALVGSIFFFFLYPLAQAAMVYSISETILGRQTDFRLSLKAIMPKAGSILVAYLLYGLMKVGAIILMYLPLIYAFVASMENPEMLGLFVLILPIMFVVLFVWGFLALKFMFIPQAVVLDDVNATGAFGRSYQLTAGYWWRTFGIWVIVSFLVGIISYMLGQGISLAELGLGFVPGIPRTAIIATGGVLTTIIMLVIQPLIIIATTLLYYDLRIRKEGFDLVLLASAVSKDDMHQPVDFTQEVPMG